MEAYSFSAAGLLQSQENKHREDPYAGMKKMLGTPIRESYGDYEDYGKGEEEGTD